MTSTSLQTKLPYGTSTSRLSALVVDNPLVDKDAGLPMRRPLYAVGMLAVGGILLFVVGMVHLAYDSRALYASDLNQLGASGRAMFVATTALALVFLTLVVPGLSSTLLTSEHERGTMPLLTVSALTPERIIAGKLLAGVILVVPFLAVVLPLYALAMLYGDVSPLAVGGGLLLLSWQTIALVAAGLGAAAGTSRAREANPRALVMGGIVGAALGIPAAIVLAMYGGDTAGFALMPMVGIGAIVQALLATACLLLARDRLSPWFQPRWRVRRPLVVFTLCALPLLAGLAAFVGGGASTGDQRDVVTVGIYIPVLLILFATALREVVTADVRAVDQRTPLRQALVVSILATIGVALVRLVPELSSAEFGYHPWDVGTLPLAAVPVLGLYTLACTTGAAATAGFVRSPPLRMVLSVGAIVFTFLAPVFLHEMRHVVPFGSWDPFFTNPAAAISGERLEAPLSMTLVAYTAAAAFFAAIASKPRA